MMKRIVSCAALAACAGLAVAQPTIDGVFDSGTEGGFYGGLLFTQNQPTGFGDNQAGDFTGGNFGLPPENVTTGIEVAIPLSSIGNATSFRLTGWVNSGDRTFLSNQIIHSNLPIDTTNIGNAPNFETDPRFPGNQWVNISAVAAGSISVDGTRDAAYGAAQFLQTNFTGFGDSTAGTEIGGGGSEIDAVYAATDGTNLYLFIAGNLEANGNALDLYLDLDSNPGTGLNVLAAAGGAGSFITGGQTGLTFDSTFGADYVVSVDSTGALPRAWAGSTTGSIDDLGTTGGYGAAGAGSLANGFSLAIDNSNVEGVIGNASQASPVAPDANWAYGSEINNVRSYIDTVNGKLYIFIGGNMQVNFNKLSLFLDVAPGGQNVLRNDNPDISFGGLNRQAGLTFESDFSADYWLNINNGVDGGNGNLINFMDCAVLRTTQLTDPFFGLQADYGCFSGGAVTDGQGNPVANPEELINFDGPRFDQQDGFSASLFAEYGPRASAVLGLDILQGFALPEDRPESGLLQGAINNSNVLGVTSSTITGAGDVNTGMEICIDLAEAGWDGVQDILLAGWIVSGDFSFVSNQVLGGLPSADNLGEVSTIDFNAIDGIQYVNLSDAGKEPCVGDWNGDTNLDFFDVLGYLADFSTQNPAADLNNDNMFDFFDVLAFLSAFSAGCP